MQINVIWSANDWRLTSLCFNWDWLPNSLKYQYSLWWMFMCKSNVVNLLPPMRDDLTLLFHHKMWIYSYFVIATYPGTRLVQSSHSQSYKCLRQSRPSNDKYLQRGWMSTSGFRGISSTTHQCMSSVISHLLMLTSVYLQKDLSRHACICTCEFLYV